MKKYVIFTLVLVVLFGVKFSNASKPSDFGLKEGDLISAIFSDDPDVYIINDQGYKRLFLNPEIFKFYSHLGGFANIKLVTSEIRDSFPTSGFFRNCEDNDQKVFGTSVEGEDTGRLHWINKSGDQAVHEDPDFFKKVFCINRKEFNWYPRGNEFKALKDVPRYNRSIEAENPVICHRPSDDLKTSQTIRVAPESLDAHFQHGDTKGACPTPFTPVPTPTVTVTPVPIPTSSPIASGSYSYYGGYFMSATLPSLTVQQGSSTSTSVRISTTSDGSAVSGSWEGNDLLKVEVLDGSTLLSFCSALPSSVLINPAAPQTVTVTCSPTSSNSQVKTYSNVIVRVVSSGAQAQGSEPYNSILLDLTITAGSTTTTPVPASNYDLSVIDVIPNPAIPEASKDFTVDVTLKNVGQKSITNPTAGLNIYDPNGKIIYSPATGYIDTINPGVTFIVKFHSDLFTPRLVETTLNFPAGTYKMVGNINYLGVVDGINYPKDPYPDNDTFTKTLEIKSVPTPTPAPVSTPTPIPDPIPDPASACLGGNGRIPGLPNCLMPENLAGTAWNEVDNATGKVINGAVCSVAVCGRNGEWRNLHNANGTYYPNGYPPNSTYIQTPFEHAYWGQYFTNGVWQTGSGGIVQPGSSQITQKTSGSTNGLAFLRNLTVGSTGNDVKNLQALLVNEVGYSADLITGYFGSITRDAVKKLQEKYGIKPTYGYFGEITRKALSALISD